MLRNCHVIFIGLFFLLSQQAYAQAFARNWDAYYGQLNVGATSGMELSHASYSLALYKMQNNHGFGLEYGGTTLGDSKLLFGTLYAAQDLVRLTRNRRSPLYIYARAGLGLTHLRNPALSDHFLLKGDDMVHLQVGLSPTYMLSRDFGIRLDLSMNKLYLIDYKLSSYLTGSIGIFFTIPALQGF
jgi:hypothetical protein